MTFVRTALLTLALAITGARLSAQTISLATAGDALHIKVPSLHFIERDILAQLKDGRSVRIDFELAVLPQPAATPIVQAGQSFVLSYDLWEERFAATQTDVAAPAGPTPRTASHLTAKDVETWCLDRVTVSMSALGRLGRDAPFWLMLDYRVREGAQTSQDDAGFSLKGLIDRLSRRTRADESKGSIAGGPFRLPR